MKGKFLKLRISILSSGSAGNTTLIESEHHKVLLDAGLSGKKIANLLAQRGVDIKDIDMVFLSHDHTDHSGGLGVLMRRYSQLNAYSNEGTWKYLQESNKIGKIPKEQINIFAPETTKIFDDLEVHSFATSHDAAEPQYYVFCSGGKRFACLTDTGYVSSSVKMQIEAADAYLMEFNYDDMMLRNGPYSWSLKQRILSDVGHLSNEQAVEVLGDVVSRETKYIFLAHISQHNNDQLLVKKSALQLFEQRDADVDSDVQFMTTAPMKPSKFIEL